MAGLDVQIEAKVKLENKSQITMLIIIGLLLFVAVSLVLYLTKSAVKKQTEKSIKSVHETAIEAAPINDFVVKCLDKLARDSVVLLGKQGGYIYKSQNGMSADYPDDGDGLFFLKYGNSNVAYNILPPSRGTSRDKFYADVPKYPWEFFPYINSVSTDEFFQGYFGRSTLPPLNSSEGSGPTMEMQIKTYIENNMDSCANFDVFKSQGFEISSNKSNASVIIGKNDVSIGLDYPVYITNIQTKESAELNEFSTKVNARLKELYFFTKSLIENDVSDVTFNINAAGNNKDSFKAALIRNIPSRGQITNDAIVKITDEKSLIGGRPFEYVFARKNRAPALYYIKNTDNLVFDDNHQLTETDLLGNSLQKNAIDPDEDPTTFLITDLSGNGLSHLPKVDRNEIRLRVQASDGKLSDYQDIVIKRR